MSILACDTARDVRSGAYSAVAVVDATLARIAGDNPRLNAFADVFAEQARAHAGAIDVAVLNVADNVDHNVDSNGRHAGRLAGVPFAVKSLFDIEGRTTIAGAAARRGREPARANAFLVDRLLQEGAILVGSTHMDELACGATGENPHFGAVRNPRDAGCMTGGSSGGSAAAVAAGIVPLALGSDTNGSIRAPAGLCGTWSIKPTFGRLSRRGTVPYAASLDCMGGFAGNVADLALLYECLLGDDPCDAAQARPPQALSPDVKNGGRLRVGVLTGYFSHYASAAVAEATRTVVQCFAGSVPVPMSVEDMNLARAAATIISNVEVAAAHEDLLGLRDGQCSDRLKTRLLAGALAPAKWYLRAKAYQVQFRARMLRLFDRFDVLLAPCTPFVAPRFETRMLTIGNESLSPAAHLGMLTQPISLAGLPVITVPVFMKASLPAGVQIITAPWREDIGFHAARIVQQECMT